MHERASTASIALQAFLVLVLVFMVAPLVIVVINSFNSSAFNAWPPPSLSLRWYEFALGYEPFRRGFRNTLIVGSVSTVVALTVGAMAAYALSRYRFHGREWIRAVFFGPLIVPRIAIGLAVFVLFLTVRRELYGSFTGLILAHVMLMLPFVIVILAANLGEIDPSVEEAARDLGAGPVRTWFSVVMPQMRSGFIVAALFAMIMSFDEVEMTIFLVRPAVHTLPVEMLFYLEVFQNPTVAAIATLLITLTVVVSLFAAVVLRGQAAWRYLRRG